METVKEIRFSVAMEFAANKVIMKRWAKRLTVKAYDLFTHINKM